MDIYNKRQLKQMVLWLFAFLLFLKGPRCAIEGLNVQTVIISFRFLSLSNFNWVRLKVKFNRFANHAVIFMSSIFLFLTNFQKKN